MPVFYKLRQDTRSTGTKLFYANAVSLGTKDTNDLADLIQQNCTVKKSDVLAVINELVETMSTFLQDSYAVKLDGFGTFKVGLKSYGAQSAKDFSVSECIHGTKINFLPEGHKATGSHKITRTFLEDITVQKYE